MCVCVCVGVCVSVSVCVRVYRPVTRNPQARPKELRDRFEFLLEHDQCL